MTHTPLPLRLALRELRGGLKGFRIFLTALFLGVFTIAAVNSLSQSLIKGLEANGRTLLGGDVELRLSQHPATAQQLEYLDRSTTRSTSIEMRAMVRPPNQPQAKRELVELKAVDGDYPLVGRVSLEEDLALTDALSETDGHWGVVLEPTLVRRMKLKVGDMISLGKLQLVYRSTLLKEPDRVASVVNFGPRLLISQQALDASGLLLPGSQIHYRYRLLLPVGNPPEEWVEELKMALPEAGWRIRTPTDAAPGVRRFIERFGLFLSFTGLSALLIGGIGVANAISSYLETKVTTIATLKCLGGTNRLVFRIYLLQVLILSVMGITLALAAGATTPWLLRTLPEGLLPVQPMAGLYPGSLLLAAAFGILTTLTFALWPLIRTRSVPAAQLFRNAITPLRQRLSVQLFWPLIGAVALASLVIITTRETRFAIWFVVITLLTLGLLPWPISNVPGPRPMGWWSHWVQG